MSNKISTPDTPDTLDVLFLHVSKFHDVLPSGEEAVFINLIPSGVFALADFLDIHGLKVKIIHLGIEWIKKGEWNPITPVLQNNPKIIGLSLHWHHQSYQVIETARVIKEAFPSVQIVIGGLTASYFAVEILKEFSFIDYVIEGDGEIPLLKLAEYIKEKNSSCYQVVEESRNDRENLCFNSDDIPNLYYRINDNIIRSSKTYSLSNDTFDSLDYCRFDLLQNSRLYIQDMGIPSIWLKDKDVTYHHTHMDRLVKVFFPVVGKGCFYNCSWCGREKRNHIIYRDMEKVIESIHKALCWGFQWLYFTFYPEEKTAHYYIELFSKLKDTIPPETSVYFEAWGLPPLKLLQSLKDTFNNTITAISPETICNEIRKSNKGIYYSNMELEQTLNHLSRLKMETDLFFAAGIPGENEDKLKETIDYIEKCRTKYPSLGAVCVFGVEMEPGSPWYESPDRFGIIKKRNCFLDFYNAHSPSGGGSFKSLGYYIPDFFKNKTIKNPEEFENFISLSASNVHSI